MDFENSNISLSKEILKNKNVLLANLEEFGKNLLERKDFEKALYCFENLVKQDTVNVKYLHFLAYTNFKIGDFPSAIKIENRCAELLFTTNDIVSKEVVFSTLAKYYFFNGDIKMANQIIESTLFKHPVSIEGKINIDILKYYLHFEIIPKEDFQYTINNNSISKIVVSDINFLKKLSYYDPVIKVFKIVFIDKTRH